ncbi:WXG100-like domain-containing protein [Streptomyces kunmingensis]
MGVNWPNVDEDDYFEMATSLRDFAEQFEGRGGDADKAVTRILNSSEGWAVESMQKHWSHVKTGHLDKIP